MGGVAEAQEPRPSRAPQSMHNAAPVMADYTDRLLFDSVWERPGLAKRDRSLVTVTALITSGNAGPLANHLNLAIENGVLPREISGLITHLAFYAGWPKAVTAAAVLRQVVVGGALSEKAEASLSVTRSGASPVTAPASYFTGTVTADTAFQGSDPARTVLVGSSIKRAPFQFWRISELTSSLPIQSCSEVELAQGIVLGFGSREMDRAKVPGVCFRTFWKTR